MKCLVTGASGFVGEALCRQLAERGVELTSVSRSGAGGVDFARSNVPSENLANVDVVFHCAGIAHRAATLDDYQRVNYRAVVELASRCEAAGVQRFIFLSSVKAQAGSDGYSNSKWAAEQDLASEFADSSMSVVIIRPSLVYGAGVKGNLRTLINAVKRGLPIPPQSGVRSLVGLPDLCDVLCRFGEQAPAGVSLFTVTDGERYDLHRLAIAARRALGKPESRVWLPLPLWRLACFGMDLMRGRWRGAGSYHSMFGSEEYSNAAVCEALAWEPSSTVEQLMPAMVNE
jgi:nucleoside-diphosphate-sugar epimerase